MWSAQALEYGGRNLRDAVAGDVEARGAMMLAATMAGVGFGPLWSLPTSLAVWCTAVVVFPILTFRFTRGVAMSSDVYYYYLAGGYHEYGESFNGLGVERLARYAR